MNLIQFSIGIVLIVGAGFILKNVNWKEQLSDLIALLRAIPFKRLFKHLLTLLVLVVCLTVHAQSRTGRYQRVITDHFSPNKLITQTERVQFKKGTIKVTEHLILIDSAQDKPQAYSVIKSYPIEKADEGYYTKVVTVIYPTKTSYRALDVVYLIQPDGKTIEEVTFKKTKNTQITYKFD